MAKQTHQKQPKPKVSKPKRGQYTKTIHHNMKRINAGRKSGRT